MKSMFFQNGNKKLRSVINTNITQKQILANPNIKNVTLDWNSDGKQQVTNRFEYMTEKGFWHFISENNFKSVKEFT